MPIASSRPAEEVQNVTRFVRELKEEADVLQVRSSSMPGLTCLGTGWLHFQTVAPTRRNAGL